MGRFRAAIHRPGVSNTGTSSARASDAANVDFPAPWAPVMAIFTTRACPFLQRRVHGCLPTPDADGGAAPPLFDTKAPGAAPHPAQAAERAVDPYEKAPRCGACCKAGTHRHHEIVRQDEDGQGLTSPLAK